MLSFFPTPYPNELLYSVIARYHFYVGNIDYKDTLEELFENRSVIPSIEFGSHLDKLVKKTGYGSTIKQILQKHTLYPFYSPFLTKERQKEIISDIKGDGKGLKARLGFLAGSICKKEGLHYCPICAKNDIRKYGEPYLHREHMLQGIDYCPHHNFKLKKYPLSFSDKSRIEYIRIEENKLDFSGIQMIENNQYTRIEFKLAKIAYEILSHDLGRLTREKFSRANKEFLAKKGFLSLSGRVKQRDLFDSFNTFFPKGFLEKKESGIDYNYEYNWLKILTRNSKRHVHPLRSLLFILYLGYDIESLINEKEKQDNPFGASPWPCLNIAADHYKEDRIPCVEIYKDYKAKQLIGTFHCSCGFIYTKRVEDYKEESRYDIGTVKEYGDVWKQKVKELYYIKRYSIRKIGRKLNVDSKTIKKYLKDYNVSHNISEEKREDIEEIKNKILKFVEENPNLSRTEIRRLNKKEYAYLYRKDKEWLFDILPVKKKKEIVKESVDWEKRDQLYEKEIKKIHQELLLKEKPVRITKSQIGKKLGILANLEKKIGKLPRTKKLLAEVTETVKEFQIRRSKIIIDEMLISNNEIIFWKVQRIAAIRSQQFEKIKPQLKEYIKMSKEEKRYEKTIS